LFDLNVDSKFIGQKLHGHAYVQADSNDIQLVSAIAVLYPRFGDAATSIQSTRPVQGNGSHVIWGYSGLQLNNLISSLCFGEELEDCISTSHSSNFVQ